MKDYTIAYQRENNIEILLPENAIRKCGMPEKLRMEIS